LKSPGGNAGGFFYTVIVSDTRLRQLEREYKTDPTEVNLKHWHRALRRAGLCENRASLQHIPTVHNTNGQELEFTIFPECTVCKLDPPLCDVEFWYTTAGSMPQQATLITTDAFDLTISNNTITGVAADGQTTYTVTWDIAFDGLRPGERNTSWGRVLYYSSSN